MFLHYKSQDINPDEVVSKIDKYDLLPDELFIDEEKALIYASKNNYNTLVKDLIKLGSAIDSFNSKDKKTPLHYAVFHKDPDLIEYLLQNKADINHLDINYTTPLMNAIMANDLKSAKALIKFNPRIDIENESFENALLMAGEYNSLEMVSFLIEKFDINTQSSKGMTMLMSYAYNGKLKMVHFLLSQGADILLTDLEGTTVLDYALRSGTTTKKEMLELKSIYKSHQTKKAIEASVPKVQKMKSAKEDKFKI